MNAKNVSIVCTCNFLFDQIHYRTAAFVSCFFLFYKPKLQYAELYMTFSDNFFFLLNISCKRCKYLLMFLIFFILDDANTQVITCVFDRMQKIRDAKIFLFLLLFSKLMFMTSLFVLTMTAVKLVSSLI